jgi:tight adherence protein C
MSDFFSDVSKLAAIATNPTNIASVVMAGAAFITAVTVLRPLVNTDKLSSRMKSVAADRDELRRKSRIALGVKEKTGLRREDTSAFKKIVAKLNLKSLLEDPNIENKLLEAGMRGPKYISMFYFARFTTPIVFFLCALAYLFVAGNDMPANRKLLIAVGACAAGFYLPNLILGNIISKRKQSIMRAFPDALDLLLICVESGMSIESAFARVSDEIGTSSIALAEELGITNSELAYLQDRRVAYENLARRTNHPGIKAVTVSLIQAEKYGTPLGSALRIMAKENREMRMTEAEKKAAALPAQLTVPMILFFLPVLFIVILTPAYIQWQNMDGRKEKVDHAQMKDIKDR